MAARAKKQAKDIQPGGFAPRTKEVGFTVTPASHERLMFAAALCGKRLSTYLRDVVEDDATRRVADEYARQRLAPQVSGRASAA